MLQFKKNLICLLFSFIFCLNTTVYTQASYPYVILSVHHADLKIGDEFYVTALTSTGNKPSWKSNNSKVASVNTYGKITAKKAGTATITAKIRNAEASCKITVAKTEITLNKNNISLEHGESIRLSAITSNHSEVTWKSQKKSIAQVDEHGMVTGVKPGETSITATSDGTCISCKVKVKTPTIRLSLASATLYRKERKKLTAVVSSGITPVWKSSKKSVAIVDSNGRITAIKHGTAEISATVDGVTSKCILTVKQPTITLSDSELTLKVGENYKMTADVSSGITPRWSSSNTSKLIVRNGTISALSKGKAYVYASEDGVKARCKVTILE